MTIQSLIDRLQNTPKPARTLDTSIGELLGWAKKVDMQTDPASGKQKRVISWRPPDGVVELEPPAYTFDLQKAYELVLQIDPQSVGAVSWDGRVRLLGLTEVKAVSPQVALCIVALMRLQELTGRP